MHDAVIARRAGIFVGGQSRRMGGEPKGLLPHPSSGKPLALHLAAVLRAAGIEEVALVGEHAAYAGLGLPMIADAPGVEGPLGGLIGLLEKGSGPALALACDLPHVPAQMLTRLASEHPQAHALMPRPEPDAPYEPLIARWSPEILPVARDLAGRGVRSLQALARQVNAQVFELRGDRERAALRDWDRPEDLRER